MSGIWTSLTLVRSHVFWLAQNFFDPNFHNVGRITSEKGKQWFSKFTQASPTFVSSLGFTATPWNLLIPVHLLSSLLRHLKMEKKIFPFSSLPSPVTSIPVSRHALIRLKTVSFKGFKTPARNEVQTLDISFTHLWATKLKWNPAGYNVFSQHERWFLWTRKSSYGTQKKENKTLQVEIIEFSLEYRLQIYIHLPYIMRRKDKFLAKVRPEWVFIYSSTLFATLIRRKFSGNNISSTIFFKYIENNVLRQVSCTFNGVWINVNLSLKKILLPSKIYWLLQERYTS